MIALGNDHAGYLLKTEIANLLTSKNIPFKDFGCHDETSCNYPSMAIEPCLAVTKNNFKCAILICGTGIGISIAANKIKGIRAAVCHNELTAKLAREHNDANVLCLGARILNNLLAFKVVSSFLNSNFQGGRHIARINEISNLESSN